MMLPLWTNVTDFFFWSMAYWIAERTRRSVPGCETGLIPTPTEPIFLLTKTDLLEFLREVRLEEFENLDCRLASRLEIDSGVNVLGVLAKNHHVDFFRMLHRARHAREILYRAQAHVEIEHLAQRHVERANAAADRRRQRSLDADQEFLERLDRVVRQPVIELGLGGFARKNLKPGNALPSAVSFFHRGIEHLLARRPDVGAGAVTPDEGNDGIIGNG